MLCFDVEPTLLTPNAHFVFQAKAGQVLPLIDERLPGRTVVT